MPPQVHSSDSESDDDVIQPKKTVTKKAARKPEEDEDDEVEKAGGEEGADGEDEDEEESEAVDEYTVEAIMDHKFEGDVSSLSLLPSGRDENCTWNLKQKKGKMDALRLMIYACDIL